MPATNTTKHIKKTTPGEGKKVPRVMNVPTDIEAEFCATTPSSKVQHPNMTVCTWCCSEHRNLKVCTNCKSVKYCSKECQKLDWKLGGHKALCPHIIDLTQRGLTTRLGTDAQRGRALYACTEVEPLSKVAIVSTCTWDAVQEPNGPREGLPESLPSKYSRDFRHYEYTFDKRIDVKVDGRFRVPLEIDGSMINDPMGSKTFEYLVSGNIAAFILSYVREAFDHMNVSPNVEGSVVVLRAVRRIPVGNQLFYSYGVRYWLEMLAAGVLPGTSFAVAWEVNKLILSGVDYPGEAEARRKFPTWSKAANVPSVPEFAWRAVDGPSSGSLGGPEGFPGVYRIFTLDPAVNGSYMMCLAPGGSSKDLLEPSKDDTRMPWQTIAFYLRHLQNSGTPESLDLVTETVNDVLDCIRAFQRQ
jgi:hypothetical protein